MCLSMFQNSPIVHNHFMSNKIEGFKNKNVSLIFLILTYLSPVKLKDCANEFPPKFVCCYVLMDYTFSFIEQIDEKDFSGKRMYERCLIIFILKHSVTLILSLVALQLTLNWKTRNNQVTIKVVILF